MQAAQQAAEAERAEKEATLARILALEALLGREHLCGVKVGLCTRRRPTGHVHHPSTPGGPLNRNNPLFSGMQHKPEAATVVTDIRGTGVAAGGTQGHG